MSFDKQELANKHEDSCSSTPDMTSNKKNMKKGPTAVKVDLDKQEESIDQDQILQEKVA